jgi:hypothetical protein
LTRIYIQVSTLGDWIGPCFLVMIRLRAKSLLGQLHIEMFMFSFMFIFFGLTTVVLVTLLVRTYSFVFGLELAM